jgi:hypothetical protein
MTDHDHDERTRRAYAAASDEDVVRSERSVADIVEEDRADPDTSDDFDVPLRPFEPSDEEIKRVPFRQVEEGDDETW